MPLTVFKEVNTPAVMSLSNDTLWDVFPAIQITVDRGSSMTKLSDIMTPKLISKNITAAIRRSSTGLPSIANCFLYKASELRNIRRNSFQMLRTKIGRLYINR